MPPLNASAIHFCQKNVSNGSYNTVRRGFQQVGEANSQSALSQPDVAIYVREGEELYRDLWDGSARAQLAITFLKDLKQPVPHRGFRVARASYSFRIAGFTTRFLFMLRLLFLFCEQLTMIFDAGIDRVQCSLQQELIDFGLGWICVRG